MSRGGNSSRKQATTGPIDIEEANHRHHHGTGKLSPYTPSTAGRGEGGPRELICLCAKAPKVPRPRNAFILFRQAYQGRFAAENPGLANPEISKLIGEKWRKQPENEKKYWKTLAEEEKERHQKQYPGYKYQPRRGGRNGSGRPTTSEGEESSGRCPKCGGRYIATPRTPMTPFSVASPLPSSKRPANLSVNMTMQPQPYPNSEHQLRHGSISSGMMPVDTSGRRYTQSYYHRDVDDDYPILSPMAAPLSSGMPPEPKRRRYNGGPVYVPVPGPGSPHMGYHHTPQQHHHQQRPSVSGPPMSATGPGHISSRQQHQQHQHQQQQPPPPPPQYRVPVYQAHHHPPGTPVMQPPPPPPHPHPQQTQRQAVAYSTTPKRPNSGFDESLRLPPLQTQVPHDSVATNGGEPGGARQPGVTPSQQSQTGLRQQQQQQQQHPPQNTPQPAQAHAQSHLQVPQRPSSPLPPKWPFLLKLEVLRSISPPLRLPGPGGPVFETRGPIIAVEGANSALQKEVAAVIERALSVSTEFAVKVWSEDTSTPIAHSSPEPHTNNMASLDAIVLENGNVVSSNGNSKTTSEDWASIGATHSQKKQSLISPIANYVARMLKWHKTSEDLVRYVTSHPPPPPVDTKEGNNNEKTRRKLPVAILSDGYSLTFSDRYASSLHVQDAYRADDHWQWVATLWRGIVGADLTVYVKRLSPSSAVSSPIADGNGNSTSGGGGGVEMAGPGIMVVRVPAVPAAAESEGGGGRIDEKLERRLGFEIAEWVRGGSFMAGFEPGSTNGKGGQLG
ncbi:hypothetical protein F5Y17DRAFT_467535 [Xylariaceae sp. FL0594]|nr:hypothetical protein F5Y17DRAFT_467535 [Xylariaceae sp. FL0594]